MRRILLLSDTHGHMDKSILKYAKEADEIWHAGDIGSLEVTDALEAVSTLRAVYGNIDNAKIRSCFPLDQEFQCEGVNVWMTHIGGYPGKYNARVKLGLASAKHDLFICGHSHILKVMRDNKYRLMHMNPGACGTYGFHQLRTMLRFTVNKGKIGDLEVVELGKR